jgi:2-dehydropantoate 2-reductase
MPTGSGPTGALPEPASQLRIAVLGAGAMGGYFAGRIAESGGSVVLVDVDQDRLDAIARDALRIEDDTGDRRVTVATSQAAALSEPVDLVIVFTKGMHTQAAVESVRRIVAAHTWFLTLQNGLGNPEQIAALFPRNPIALGVTDVPADVAGPAHVRSHGAGSVHLWSLSGENSQPLQQIRSLLDTAGIACTADPDIRTAIWEKASFNGAMNALCALCRVPVGGLDNPDGRALIEAIVAEAVATAMASGVPVDPARIRSRIDFALAHHRTHEPSMLQDMRAGRETEIETINGAIARAAEAHDIPAPMNAMLTRLVRLAQSRG